MMRYSNFPKIKLFIIILRISRTLKCCGLRKFGSIVSRGFNPMEVSFFTPLSLATYVVLDRKVWSFFRTWNLALSWLARVICSGLFRGFTSRFRSERSPSLNHTALKQSTSYIWRGIKLWIIKIILGVYRCFIEVSLISKFRVCVLH